MTLPTDSGATQGPAGSQVSGSFVAADGLSWYRIEGANELAPFFVSLAGDSDLWAFISTAGSLTCGRRDQDGAFLPYETVDKIYRRWQHTGPRSWVWLDGAEPGHPPVLWQPFAQHEHAPLDQTQGRRSIWKDLSGTRLRFREVDPSGRVALTVEWSSAAALGVVRSAWLQSLSGQPVKVRLLDGVLNLLPPGVSFAQANTMSSLTDAYKWNESAAGGRLGLYTLYAQIWDRAEPKESFHALTAWHAGLPPDARTLLSDKQISTFCRTGTVQAETLTRGRRGAFLVNFDTTLAADGSACEWQMVLDGPRSQVQVFELAQRLQQGAGSSREIKDALARNTAGVDALLARADGLQTSGDAMAAAHHRANVLFNIMRGGVFLNGTALDRDDLLAFVRQRLHTAGDALATAARSWPPTIERSQALAAAQALGPQVERLVLEYLPLSFSRRHGDPSRPWNRFSIRVHADSRAAGADAKRVISYQGNWRDIFQNWEALATSEPGFLGSMISTFLSAMTPDGYNPYRISREGIDWEVPEPEDPWSHIGYWGDHQIIYLLRLLQAQEARDPAFLSDHWNKSLFGFADVPYRLKPHAQMAAQPRDTIVFDGAAHAAAHARATRLGADGLRVCDAAHQPVLATLGEKLAVLLLAKAGSLVPGGGMWLHTQRPEWNDANNALAGNGLSVVTLAYLRRLLMFIQELPASAQAFALPEPTLQAVLRFTELVQATPLSAVHDATQRRAFMDGCGALLDPWRAAAYLGHASRAPATAPAGLLATLASALLPLVDATLAANSRADGLFNSYNLLALPDGRAEVSHLYPMLEGQVAMLSCDYLSPAVAVQLLNTLFASPLYTAERDSFLLYPDRALPGFLERNQLDDAALALPITQQLLKTARHELLQQQSDGVVRFAPQLANRADLEQAGADLGSALTPLAEAYERLLGHHAFTGRSGTMFGYEGLGCIYWHMVAKLLLAVQENVWAAADSSAPELPALIQHYRRVRDGLGYKRGVVAYGAFPADPYSHTPGEGGAQQPGMTGQVKEEILTRWGELGLRVAKGRVHFNPVLLDAAEVPPEGSLRFTYARIPCTWQRGPATCLRVRTPGGWQDSADLSFDPATTLEIKAEISFGAG